MAICELTLLTNKRTKTKLRGCTTTPEDDVACALRGATDALLAYATAATAAADPVADTAARAAAVAQARFLYRGAIGACPRSALLRANEGRSPPHPANKCATTVGPFHRRVPPSLLRQAVRRGVARGWGARRRRMVTRRRSRSTREEAFHRRAGGVAPRSDRNLASFDSSSESYRRSNRHPVLSANAGALLQRLGLKAEALDSLERAAALERELARERTDATGVTDAPPPPPASRRREPHPSAPTPPAARRDHRDAHHAGLEEARSSAFERWHFRMLNDRQRNAAFEVGP